MNEEPKGPGGHSKRGSHRLGQAGWCDRKWYFRWGRKLVPTVRPIYFLEGTLAHIALAYYRANQLYQRGMKVPPWFFEETMQACLERNGVGFPDAIRLGLSIYAAYERHYANNDPWEPVAIEEEYFASLGQIRKLIDPTSKPRDDDEEVFSCRIDLMLRTNGFLWACDYKTTKYAYKEHLSRFNPEGEFAINFQFLLQTAILRVNFGTEFRGVVIERILKTGAHDFDRVPAPLNEAMFKSLPATLSKLAFIERFIVKQATEAVANGVDMETWMPETASPWGCYSWGQPCEYSNLCRANTSGQLKDTVVREYTTAA